MIYFQYNTKLLPYIRFVGHVNYKEPWLHFKRAIDEYIIYIIKEGELHIKEDGNNYILKSGDIFILEPNLIHEGTLAKSCEYYYIHFKKTSLKPLLETNFDVFESLKSKRRIALMSDALSYNYTGDGILYFPKLYNIKPHIVYDRLNYMVKLFYNKEEFYREATSTLVHSLILYISHQKLIEYINEERKNTINKSEIICEQIIDYVNKNYMKQITSYEISEIFEVNFDYINRIFKKLMGTTIFKYINEVKINNAKQMLENTNLKISDIAYLIGIEDQFYFSRVFKQYTGMTPTEYYKYIRIKR